MHSATSAARGIASTVTLDVAPEFDFSIASVGMEPWALVMSARVALDIGNALSPSIDYSGLAPVRPVITA